MALLLALSLRLGLAAEQSMAAALAHARATAESGQYLESLTLLDAIDASAPSSSHYGFDRAAIRGFSLLRLERFDEAIAPLERALRFNSTRAVMLMAGYAHRMLGNNLKAMGLLEDSLTDDDADNGNALLHLGDIYAAQMLNRQAVMSYIRAHRVLGTRKSLRKLGFAIRWLSQDDREYLRLAEDAEAALYAAAVASGLLNVAEQRPDSLTAGLTAKAWHEPSEFAWLAPLESRLPDTIAEYWAALSAAPELLHRVGAGRYAHDTELYANPHSRRWNELVLFEQGVPGAAAAHFPKTVAWLLAAVPDAVSFGRCVISVIEPGVRIVPHTGPNNERLTVHCGLAVPTDGVAELWLRVGAERREWTQGRCAVFDDSFEHEVWYKPTSGVFPGQVGVERLRAVLLFHIQHPDLVRRRAAAAAADDDAVMRMMFGSGEPAREL